MPDAGSSKIADALTYFFAVSLAATCIAFAGYKVLKLRGMENPPADMGLNFPPPKRKIITDDTILVDPLTTGSTAGDSGAREKSGQMEKQGRILQPYTNDAPIQDYRLLTVIDGVGFVEVLTLQGKQIMPLAAGAKLPGAGRVDSIGIVDGRWTLVAGDVTLKAERR